MQKHFRLPALLLALLLSGTGCASHVLKGVSSNGEKVYLSPLPIEKTGAYQEYLRGRRTELDKQHYLFQRLKMSDALEFFHDGCWYGALEAYRGGMWLMRNRYQKGQDTRTFIRKYVERSEDTGKLHLVRYPDGSTHIGSYVLLNELDQLEDCAARDLKT